MKTIKLTILMLLMPVSIVIQGQTIIFGYDDAGNRESRAISQMKSGIVKFPLEEKFLNDTSDVLAQYFSVFPNPVISTLSLEIENWLPEGSYSYVLYDMQGKVLLRKSDCGPVNSINMLSMQKGIYLLRVIANFSIIDFKIIKSH